MPTTSDKTQTPATDSRGAKQPGSDGHADRPRHLSLPRRNAWTALRRTGLPARERRRNVRRLGTQCGAGVGDRRRSTSGIRRAHPLAPRGDGSGVWTGSVAGVARGDAYKYHIVSAFGGYAVDKADPFAFYAEAPAGNRRRAPGHSTTTGVTTRGWHSGGRVTPSMRRCRSTRCIWGRGAATSPVVCLTYRDIASALADYVREMGFTHVELLPVTEHPFYGSWGYQTTGYFAPTARYGTPQDFMYLVDVLHQHGIGVILDWVPSHFPSDEHGLAYFDGTHLYEHADPKQGFHPEWKSCDLQLRPQRGARIPAVERAVLARPLSRRRPARRRRRLDAVSRLRDARPGEWIPNVHGGKENLDAIAFLRQLERGGVSRSSRRADDRRGVDRVADGVAAGLRRRTRASA